MKTAYLISTGTELLLGSTNDSNSIFLAEKMMERGIKVIGKTTVGDSRDSLRMAFAGALGIADIVISSGGLGPTKDDLTKEMACLAMGCEVLTNNQEEVKRLKEFFARRHKPMPESNLKQALFPPEAEIVVNQLGTAPGMYLKKDNKVLILLPGPPREMEDMYNKGISPKLERDFPREENRIICKTIKILGPGESQVEKMLDEVPYDESGLNIALLAIDGEIHLKLTADGEDASRNADIMDKACRGIEKVFDRHIVGYDNDTLLSVVATYLLKRGKKLAVAESCTGGLLAKMISDLPGSSAYFWGSMTTYSNEAKMVCLGVKRETLEEYSAISSEIAEEMVRGIQKISGLELALSITGLAGPDGATEDKPVGLVYIALAEGDYLRVKEMHFVGNRESIRILAAKSALDLLRRHLETGR